MDQSVIRPRHHGSQSLAGKAGGGTNPPPGRSDRIPASVVSHRPSPDWHLAGNAVGVIPKDETGQERRARRQSERPLSGGGNGAPLMKDLLSAEELGGSSRPVPAAARTDQVLSPEERTEWRISQPNGKAQRVRPSKLPPSLRFPNRNRPQALYVRLRGAAPRFSIGWGAIKNCSRSYVRSF